MRREHVGADAGASTVVAWLTARRAARSGGLWGLVFGSLVVSSAASYSGLANTAEQRAKLAASLGANSGMKALLGGARRLDTVAGFTAWRSLGVLVLVGAVWGVLTGTRLTRGEESSGRWEILLSGPTTRGRAAAQTMAGLGTGLVCLWAVTAVFTVVEGHGSNIGFGIGGSLFLSVALVAGAAMFLAIGALAGQIAATRRQANVVAAAVFGASFLLRMTADSSSGLEWLRWASPLGWVEELHPLTGSRPAALIPIATLTIAAAVIAAWTASRRDLGASVLPSHDRGDAHTRLLGHPIGLTLRLTRPVAVGWMVGLGVLGLVGGLVARSAAQAVSGSDMMQRALARLGAHRGGAADYLGIFFLIAAAAIAFAAAGQLAAIRGEEADGHLDNLLAGPVDRRLWLAGRVVVGAGVIVAAGVTVGLAGWIGAATQHSDIGVGALLAAGINLAPPALVILGVGALAYGIAPRLASPITYGLVAWSFLIQIVGTGLHVNHWLLDTSLLMHIAPAPATNPNWAAVAWLTGLGVLAGVVGIIGFDRRDLVGA